MGDTNNKSKQSVKSCGKPTKLNTHIKGTIGEYQEIVNLTKAGWHISKSCDPQCPFDLVTVSPTGNVQLLDIKTNTFRKNIFNLDKEKRKRNVIDFTDINNLNHINTINEV